MNQIGSIKQVRYIEEILPELFWIALIADQLDFVPAARVVERFSRAVAAAVPSVVSGRVFASSYTNVTSGERQALVDALDSDGLLDTIRRCISPLNQLYSDSPLAFLGYSEKPHEECVIAIESCVADFINKYETPGVVLNAMVMVSELSTDSLVFSRGVDLPDFNAVLSDPDSDEARRAAGLVRAHTLTSFGMQQITPLWARAFWNRNYELSECVFGVPSDAE